MVDIKSLTYEELEEYIVQLGESRYRAGQIFKALANGLSISEMTNLSKALRSRLCEECIDTAAVINRDSKSRDGTRKFLYGFADGENVETVLMKYKYGNTVCVSSQAGCRMGCRFCASAVNGFRRSLSAGEILEQVVRTRAITGENISHVVLMGIGEPLDNFDNVIRFINIVNDSRGFGLGMRRISLSTCGLVDGIDRLAKLDLQLTLSVSLHAPNDEIRRKIMPVALRYPYESLMEACSRYEKRTGRRISFEYAMLEGINDSIDCANELGQRLSGTLAHVNLIPYNRVSGKNFGRSGRETIRIFAETLEKYGVNTTVRRALGSDIDAACGQLRAKNQQI